MQLEFRLNHSPESLFFFPLPPYTFCEQKLLRDYWKERHYSRRVLQQAEKMLYHLGWAYFSGKHYREHWTNRCDNEGVL